MSSRRFLDAFATHHPHQLEPLQVRSEGFRQARAEPRYSAVISNVLEVQHGKYRRHLHYTCLRSHPANYLSQRPRKLSRTLRTLIRISSYGAHDKAVKIRADEGIAARCGSWLTA